MHSCLVVIGDPQLMCLVDGITWKRLLLSLLVVPWIAGCWSHIAYDRGTYGAYDRPEPTALRGASWIDLPLTVHYATSQGITSTSPERVLISLERANEALAPYGIRLFISENHILPQGYAKVDSDEDRFALAELAHQNGTIHVFFVEGVALFHPSRADARVSGMHWRYRGFSRSLRSREYLVVAQDAPSTTFAHEVGHALGLGHQFAKDNLMCSCRRDPGPEFTALQGKKMRTGARNLLRRVQ